MNNIPLAILWGIGFILASDVTIIVIAIRKNGLDEKIIIVGKPLWEGLGLIWKFIEMREKLKTKYACIFIYIKGMFIPP